MLWILPFNHFSGKKIWYILSFSVLNIPNQKLSNFDTFKLSVDIQAVRSTEMAAWNIASDGFYAMNLPAG